MEPLVSVIIPVYNVEQYLEECLNSVAMQNYQNIEVIMVNDGSKDKSGSICDTMARQDSRFHVYHQENKGVSEARNLGIQKAVGEYVLFIDSDDRVPHNYIESLMDANVQSDLVLCSIGKKTEKKEEEFSFKNYNEDIFVEWNKIYLLYPPSGKLYKMEIIRKNNILFPSKVHFGEDLIFNFKYMEYIDKIRYTNKTYYNYRSETENSLSKKFRYDYFETGKMLKDTMIYFLKKRGIVSEKLIRYYYDRLFDDAYNSIFQIHHIDFKGNIWEKYKYVRKILCDKDLIYSYQFADLKKYSEKIVTYMKKKQTLCFMIYSGLSRRIKK